MASPHIAGLAAYFGSLEGWESGAAMCDRLVSAATEGKIAGIPDGTTSRLAFNANPSG